MLTCPGRLLPMVVVLGLVLTAGVLSVQRVVEVSDEQDKTAWPWLWAKPYMVQYLHRLDTGQAGWQVCPVRLRQEEALDVAFHTFARGLGASAILVRLALDSFDADPDDTLSMAGLPGDRVEAEQGIQELPSASPQDTALGRASDTDDTVHNPRATGGDAAGDSSQQDAGAPPGAALGEVIDVGINRGDTATGSTGDLFWLTTYTCEEGYCGFTANNVQVAPGMAACSEHWAFGTHFLIAGQWLVDCQDRGSGVVLRNHLDIYFETSQDAEVWLAQVGDHAKVEVMP